MCIHKRTSTHMCVHIMYIYVPMTHGALNNIFAVMLVPECDRPVTMARRPPDHWPSPPLFSPSSLSSLGSDSRGVERGASVSTKSCCLFGLGFTTDSF